MVPDTLFRHHYAKDESILDEMPSDKMSRLDVVSLWNLAGDLAAVLPSRLTNFRATMNSQYKSQAFEISRYLNKRHPQHHSGAVNSVVTHVCLTHWKHLPSTLQRTRLYWQVYICFACTGFLSRILKYGIFIQYHDDAMTWKSIPHYWPFVMGIHRPMVPSIKINHVEHWYFPRR